MKPGVGAVVQPIDGNKSSRITKNDPDRFDKHRRILTLPRWNFLSKYLPLLALILSMFSPSSQEDKPLLT